MNEKEKTRCHLIPIKTRLWDGGGLLNDVAMNGSPEKFVETKIKDNSLDPKMSLNTCMAFSFSLQTFFMNFLNDVSYAWVSK